MKTVVNRKLLAKVFMWMTPLIFLSSCMAMISGSITKTIEFAAPVEKVFSFMADPASPTICDPNYKISNVQGEGLGMTWYWALYSGSKLKYEGDAIIVDYDPNRLLVIQGVSHDGTLGSLETYIFVPVSEDKTKMVMIVEGSAPFPVSTRGTQRRVVKKAAKVYEELEACWKRELEN